MFDLKRWNESRIREFRANEGRLGGQFEGIPMLILHSLGARSKEPRVSPMVYQEVDGGYAVFGTFAGSETNPSWYYNVRANPEVTVELGDRTVAARARETEGDERARIWTRQKEIYPLMADYEQRANRTIPVIVLEPVE